MNKKFEIEIDKPENLQFGSDLQVLSIEGQKIVAQVKPAVSLPIKKKSREELEELIKKSGVKPFKSSDDFDKLDWPFDESKEDLHEFIMNDRKVRRAGKVGESSK